MYCPSGSIRCLDQGYCNCHHDSTEEAAGGCGGLLFLMVVGIFAAFLYPAIRIFRSNINYGANGSPNFAGAVWLFTSPVFGFLATMLYQVVFALGACAAEAMESKVTASVYIAGIFLIYVLAIGLAVIAFLIKNRTALKLFATEPVSRNFSKAAVLVGLAAMTVLTILAAARVTFVAAEGYYTVQSAIQDTIKQYTTKNEKQLISGETAKFDSYAGKYKLITRSSKELFVVTKSNDGKNLRLNMDGGKGKKTKNTEGCILTPSLEGESIYYNVSECIVDGKLSPLEKVYFDTRKSKITMSFVYNVRANGDTLEKVR